MVSETKRRNQYGPGYHHTKLSKQPAYKTF